MRRRTFGEPKNLLKNLLKNLPVKIRSRQTSNIEGC